jgi:hypothetical protein
MKFVWRALGPVLVLVLLLAGACALDGGSDGTPAAGGPATPNPSPDGTGAGAQLVYNLGAAEARGGHTLEKHVGRTDAQLIQRLKDEPDISAASSYRDRETAERTVAAALGKGSAQLDRWVKGASHPNLALRITMPDVIGRSVDHGSTKVVDVKSAVVVLTWDDGDWFVLTSYPEER